jgi:hypothetical protein
MWQIRLYMKVQLSKRRMCITNHRVSCIIKIINHVVDHIVGDTFLIICAHTIAKMSSGQTQAISSSATIHDSRNSAYADLRY